MDRLAERLREDAASIDAEIPAGLDDRIRASLTSVEPQRAKPMRRKTRAPSFWWASSVTGIAATILVIAIINLNRETPPDEIVAVETPPQFVVPRVDLDVEAAMLTDPLAQELEALREDLRKVEETVRDDVRFDF
jgi:hypothetical protein